MCSRAAELEKKNSTEEESGDEEHRLTVGHEEQLV